MGPRRGPKHKLSRRFGIAIFGTGGAALERRLDTHPVQHAREPRRRRISEYGLQLTEKQKVKAIYGISERQFRRYFATAQRLAGVTGHNLLRLLELRLDNIVYLLGFARSRPMARQMVGHSHVLVNGRRDTIASRQVRPGDRITLSDTTAHMPVVVEELASNRPVPRWLQRDGMVGQVVEYPHREDLDVRVHENLIVTFYAR
jgi:small subunit ribosomal protein S4